MHFSIFCGWLELWIGGKPVTLIPERKLWQCMYSSSVEENCSRRFEKWVFKQATYKTRNQKREMEWNKTKWNETGKGSTPSCVRTCTRCTDALYTVYMYVRTCLCMCMCMSIWRPVPCSPHWHIVHAQLTSSITSLSKFSRLSSSSDDSASDLEQLLSQVKRKRARRRLFRATSLVKDDDISLLPTTTKVS